MPYKIKLKFPMDVLTGTSCSTTGSQRLALPLNASLLFELPSLLQGRASFQRSRESDVQSSLSSTIALLRFPPLNALPVGALFEKAIVYCIHGS
jgi:hypothetical protein